MGRTMASNPTTTERDLHERVKELSCLYAIAQIAGRPTASLDEVLQGIVDVLPSAWQCPDLAVASLRLDDTELRSSGRRAAGVCQRSPLVVHGIRRGHVAVGYAPGAADGESCVLLEEEQSLLDEVARQVSLIIDRRETAAEQERLRSKLLHADRLATLGQLAAGVAHELNEPLGSILGFAQLVAKVPRLPRQAREDVGRIEAASLRARDVIRQLMAFARQTPPREGRVDVNRLILKSADLWRPRCQTEGIRLEYALDPGLPETLADESQLRQVVTNLVINAVQAMPEGGTLRIETTSRDGAIRLAVRDTGTGIAPEVLPRIFDPFFTTKDVDQGTGLGLSLVHGIVVGHGGRVEASSEPGHGTCVTVTLPVRTPVEDDGEDGEGRDGED